MKIKKGGESSGSSDEGSGGSDEGPLLKKKCSPEMPPPSKPKPPEKKKADSDAESHGSKEGGKDKRTFESMLKGALGDKYPARLQHI